MTTSLWSKDGHVVMRCLCSLALFCPKVQQEPHVSAPSKMLLFWFSFRSPVMLSNQVEDCSDQEAELEYTGVINLSGE